MSASLLSHIPDIAAARAPNDVAFRCLDAELTYSEFAAQVAQLSKALQENSVTPGDRVGIYLRKSLHSALAIYAILRAGAVYVPLDPTAPADRIANIVVQCDIRFLVSAPPMQALLKTLLDKPTPLKCIFGVEGPLALPCVSWDEIANTPEGSLVNRDADETAYIMFTSGSTGTPKGMVHTHRSGLTYAYGAAKLYELSPRDIMANHSALHFDMSTFAMIAGPLAGAKIVIVPDAYARLPAQMSKLIQDEAISVWYSVPFALTQMLEHGALAQRDISSLRWMIFAGEPILPKHLHALMAEWPQARFSNNYGPAEVNLCTYHHLETTDEVPDTGIPIGRVWDAARGIILAPDDSEAQTGELAIASASMMRGYWNAPELTARSLYHHSDGTVFYRTGDLVIDRGDGILHLLGRKDRQVKLRGFRIELDEVEAAVVLSDDRTQLVAAVTFKDGEATDEKTLLAHAAASLASYAVPSRIHILKEFPRTGTEKIDRKAILKTLS